MKTEESLIFGSKMFFNALREGKGIQEIVDMAYELLGNPIQVIDASYKVLAYTKNVNIDDPHWHKIVDNRYLPYHVVTNKDIRNIFLQCQKSKRPLVQKTEVVDFEFVHTGIIMDNKIFGYLIIPCIIKTFTENDMENVALLSDILALTMQKNKYSQHSKEVIYEFFLADLLDGNITGRDVIIERLKCLNWTLHENIYVLTIRKKQTDFADDFYLAELSRSISYQIYGSKPIIYNNSIVLVINRKKKFPNEHEMTYLTELLKKNDMYGGISRSFHGMEDIAGHFKQSIKASDLGEKLNKQKLLYVYDEYAISDLMSICAAQADLKSFCHPSIFLLAEHDRQYSDELTPCLYEYLSNNKNLKKTASNLGIHRNTMRYRLKKIQEIMNADINDEEISFHLLLSLKMFRFIEVTKFEQ